MLVALALLGGVGTVYAPVPTFIVVAVILALGLWALWAFVGSSQPSIARLRTLKRARLKPRGTRVTRLVSGYLLLFWLGLLLGVPPTLAGASCNPTAVLWTSPGRASAATCLREKPAAAKRYRDM